LLCAAMDGAAQAEPVPEHNAPSQKILRINKITLKGCKQLQCKTVKALLREQQTPWYQLKLKEGGYDPFWAESDRDRIELYYRARGFYSAKVDAPEVKTDKKGTGVSILYRISEGAPVKVSGLELNFADPEKEGIDRGQVLALIKKIKKGDRFEIETYQATAGAIESYYKDRGYYRAEVERKAVVDPEQKSAEVSYLVKAGDRYRVDQVAIEGCKKTKPGVAGKALLVKKGQWYSRKDVIESSRRVGKMPIYQSNRIEEKVDDQQHLVDLTVLVEEAKPNALQLGLGYGSEEGVRVQGSWSNNNFLGGARQVKLSARWSRLLETEEIDIIQPSFPKFEDYASLSAQRKVVNEKSYSDDSLAMLPAYHWYLSEHLFIDFSYRIEQNHVRSFVDLTPELKDQLSKEGLLSAVTAGLQWAPVDNLIKPTKGFRLMLMAETGGGPLGGNFEYYKTTAEARAYHPVYEKVVAAGRAKVGWEQPSGGMKLMPSFLRFYSGGVGSVRGFDRHMLGPLDKDRDPVGGSKLLEAGLELRFPIYANFGAATFIEGGWVWLEDQNYDLRDMVFSAGFGLRYDTVVGPISLDVGFPLSTNPAYPDYRIQVNIGEAF
jgi:translocation and assembly module TamA